MAMTLSWYYLDPESREFGPFRSDQMRAWWDQGYFYVGELLLVRLQEWKEHRRISEVYPADKSAYFVMPPGCDGGFRHHEFIPHVAQPCAPQYAAAPPVYPGYGHPGRMYGSTAVAHPGYAYPPPGYRPAHPPPPHGYPYSLPSSPPGHPPPGLGYGYGGYRGGRSRSRPRSRSRSSRKGEYPAPSGGPPQSSLERDGDCPCCQQEEEEEEEGCFDCSDCDNSLWSAGKLGYCKPIAAPARSASSPARDTPP